MAQGRERTRFGGIGEAFADLNFRIYSVGSIGSWISYFVQIVTVGWLTWELTGSTRWLAALVLIHGILISFMVPAMYGTVPRFVARECAASAIAVSSSYSQLAVFLGPAFAGWIIFGFGTTPAFVVNALGYMVLIAALLCLRTPPGFRQPPRSSRTLFGDIADGFAYIRRTPVLMPLLTISLVGNAVSGGLFHMMPAYADTILGEGVAGLSTILSMLGLGAIGAALWLAHGRGGAARVDRILWSFLASTLASAALVMTTDLYVAAGLAAILGFAYETRKTSTFTIIQLAVEEGQRGRVMGTVFMIAQLAAGIGTYLVGSCAVDAGIRLPVLIGTAISLGL